jgi:hypothetical protein
LGAGLAASAAFGAGLGLGSSFLGAGFSAYTTDKRQSQDI